MPPINVADVVRGGWIDRSAILCDLDGCLIAGDRVLPGVPALLAAAGSRVWIVSNNSTDTAESLAGRLRGLGLEIEARRIILAGEQTLRVLAGDRPAARIALFAAPPLTELAETLGLVLSAEKPDFVVLARDVGFSFEKLARLAALVHGGAKLHITNPDLSHPGPDGAPRPETGALLAAVAAVAPPEAVACIGKPAPDLLMLALSRAGASPADAVYLGDTPETDGLAAKAAAVEFVQIVRPGGDAAGPLRAATPLAEASAC